MPIRRVYTPEEKAHALDLYVRVGPCQAARETGIKKPTIRGWAKKAGLRPPTENISEGAKSAEARVAAKRAAIKEKLIDRASEMLDRMGEGMTIYVGTGATPIPVQIDKPPAGVCKDLATTVGILIDKFRLEAGETTSNEKVTVDELSGSRERLAQQLSRIAERGEPPADHPVAD